MNRSKLIVTPASSPNEEGSLLTVTPESAGWKYVGFEVVQLAEGQILEP